MSQFDKPIIITNQLKKPAPKKKTKTPAKPCKKTAPKEKTEKKSKTPAKPKKQKTETKTKTKTPAKPKKQKTKITNAATPVKIGEPKTPAIKIIPCKPRKLPKPIDPNKVSEPAKSTRQAKKRLYAEDAFIQSSDTFGDKKARTEFFSSLCDCDHDCDCN